MSIDSSFKQLKVLRDQILSLQTEFLKHIVSISGVLLALLVSLHSPSSSNNYLFYLVLCTLLVSILFGTIALYIILSQFRKMDKDFLAAIKSQLQNQEDTHKGVFSKYNKLLLGSERTCVIAFLISMISLVFYAFSL